MQVCKAEKQLVPIALALWVADWHISPVILWKKVEQIATEANLIDFVSSICPE